MLAGAVCGAALVAVVTATALAVQSSDEQEAGPARPTTAPPPATVEAPCPPPGPAGARRPLVAFVGDSTTALAAMPTDLAPDGALAGAFGDGYRIHVEAQFGQTIGDMLDEVEAVLDDPSGPPDALVLNLGTNDAVQDTTDWPAAFDEMLSLVEDHPCVLLVTVNESTDAFLGSTGTTATSINARIAEAVTAPNIFHVDWNEDWGPESGFTPDVDHFYSVYAPPEALPPDLRASHPMGMWVRDGVHQSPEGSVELANRIRRILDQASSSTPT